MRHIKILFKKGCVSQWPTIQDFLHLGAKISRATIANWIITCSQDYLVYMYEFLHKKLLERMFLMADETPIQVLKEPERKPQSGSYVWVFRTGEDRAVPIILFNYAPTRKGANAASFVEDAPKGYLLMTDGYKGGTTKFLQPIDVPVGHTSEGIGYEPFLKVIKRIIRILWDKEFFTAISCLVMKEPTKKKDFLLNRFISVVSRNKNL